MNGKISARLLLGVCCGIACTPRAAAAASPPAPCEAGYRIVEETCYREVVHKVCRMVPDVKKTTKVVYDYKVVDYYLPKKHGLRCSQCGQCGCSCGVCGKPRTKRVLMKKFVTVEQPTCKCVVECIVERVPYTVYRKVRCDDAVLAPLPPQKPELE